MVHLWRGFHHGDLPVLLKRSWEQGDLTILVPPSLKDLGALSLVSSLECRLHGEWSEEHKNILSSLKRDLSESEAAVLRKAVLGVFTSGTGSGQPRLVLYSKENLQSSLASIRSLFENSPIENIFVYPQPTHTFGLVLGYMHAILHELPLHFEEGPYGRKTHEKWLSVVNQGTLTLGAPAHFYDLLKFVRSEKIQPPSSSSAIAGGARVSVALWNQMVNELRIQKPSVGYGATEASPGVTHLPPGLSPREDGDIGFALKDVSMSLIKDEGVEFSGPNVCLALFERNELKSPDRIRLRDSLVINDREGSPRYTYVGRTDVVINRGGIKASLEVIEACIASAVDRPAMAFAFYDERLGQELGLMIESEEESEFSTLREKARKSLKESLGFPLTDGQIVFGKLPLNANGKFHRNEAQKTFMQTKQWSFPLSVEHLRSFLPHRPPAIWVDSVLETHPTGGLVEVKLKKSARYFGDQGIRQSACIEWVAQAYGYVVAMNVIRQIDKMDPASQTFVAEVKSCEFFQKDLSDLKEGDSVLVRVHCTHNFGKLKIVEGEVLHDEKSLAKVNMKLYCS